MISGESFPEWYMNYLSSVHPMQAHTGTELGCTCIKYSRSHTHFKVPHMCIASSMCHVTGPLRGSYQRAVFVMPQIRTLH